MSDAMAAALARCDREIEALKAEARAGNPDVSGIMLGLRDWRDERRAILDPKFGEQVARRIRELSFTPDAPHGTLESTRTPG